MRPFLTAARAAVRPAARPLASSSASSASAAASLQRASARQALPTIRARTFSSTPPPRRPRYERFDTPSFGQGGGGVQNVHHFLRRRLGGDRGVLVFGIAIGGGLIYYVAQ
jgi:hypothetical protein